MRIFICDESEHKPNQLGRATILPEVPNLQLLIEEPVDFENEVKFQLVDKSCVMGDSDQSEYGGHTLLLLSVEDKIGDGIAQMVSKSRKRLEVHKLDYTPDKEPISTEISLHGTSEIQIARQSKDRTMLLGML